jgi:hypothetical protein
MVGLRFSFLVTAMLVVFHYAGIVNLRSTASSRPRCSSRPLYDSGTRWVCRYRAGFDAEDRRCGRGGLSEKTG